MAATETHRTIEAVWRIESARVIAGLTRIVRDVGVAEELAQDALVEIKAGKLYRTRFYSGVPILFDAGDHAAVDVVRITWPNGLIQNEPKQPVTTALNFKEAQRLSGSCPMIFAWNGKRFEFITDVLGVAPLGASSGDGNYFPGPGAFLFGALSG